MNDDDYLSMDVSTQDILGTIRSAPDADNLFFLYIATPGGAPSKLHSKIVKPLLLCRGWKKVNYKTTGFRALYFLDLNSCKDYLPSADGGSSSEVEDHNANVKAEINKNGEFSPLKTQSPSKPPLSRAAKDRSDLRKAVERFKEQIGGNFTAHIILCKPIDYEEDFLEFASQPSAIE